MMMNNSAHKKISGQRAVLIYDPECVLCHNTVRFIESQDINGRFELLERDTKRAEDILHKSNFQFVRKDTVMLVYRGEVKIKSEAVLEIFNILGGVWQILLPFKLIPKPLRDFLYGLVQRYRYRIFGRIKRE